MQKDPNTYSSFNQTYPGWQRPKVFDPALKHFVNGFRLGDPIFQDSEIGQQWLKKRRQAIDWILTIIANSDWSKNLILRGSLLLKAWLGDLAREPGDIDWVFHPKDVSIDDPISQRLFSELISLVSASPQIGDIKIEVANIAIDDIWTYDRAPGKRIVFPWKVEGFPPGEVQMDVVFSEDLFIEPIQTEIPSLNQGNILLWSANPEISLAWKLLWLVTDIYPQGKDFYDATLLAEETSLSFKLLHQVLQSNDSSLAKELRFETFLAWLWDVDWKNFQQEYPWVEGDLKHWHARLSKALAPTFDQG